jgi:outer membrane lipoprotein-sorting protein
MRARNPHVIAAFALPLLLSGCGLLPTTRHLPVPKAPALVQNATPEELVAQMDQRWNDFSNLTATVQIKATLLKAQEGLERDYPSCRGWIVMEKPDSLRIAGQLVGVRIFDMASDGKNFTLLIPPKSKAIQGSNSVAKKSKNPFENLRPTFFFDSMVVRGTDPDNYFTVISDTETVEDAAKKHLFTMPEYVLSITRHGPSSHRDIPVRVVTFHRDDLLPYNQDLYDAQGNLESQVSYSGYQTFGDGKFPTRVTIKRPLEGIQIVLTVEKVDKNQKLPQDEFTVKIPPGTQVQHLE